MSDDLMKNAAIAAIRFCILILGSRGSIKSFITLAYINFLAVIFLLLPISVQARDSSNIIISPDQIMSQLKERLRLTEEQEEKVRPIIEDSLQKRSQILANNLKDRKTVRSELQELQWTTNMRLGKVLTEEQMKEYEKFNEEQSDKKQHKDVQRAGRSRTGGLRGL